MEKIDVLKLVRDNQEKFKQHMQKMKELDEKDKELDYEHIYKNFNKKEEARLGTIQEGENETISVKRNNSNKLEIKNNVKYISDDYKHRINNNENKYNNDNINNKIEKDDRKYDRKYDRKDDINNYNNKYREEVKNVYRSEDEEEDFQISEDDNQNEINNDENNQSNDYRSNNEVENNEYNSGKSLNNENDDNEELHDEEDEPLNTNNDDIINTEESYKSTEENIINNKINPNNIYDSDSDKEYKLKNKKTELDYNYINKTKLNTKSKSPINQISAIKKITPKFSNNYNPVSTSKSSINKISSPQIIKNKSSDKLINNKIMEKRPYTAYTYSTIKKIKDSKTNEEKKKPTIFSKQYNGKLDRVALYQQTKSFWEKKPYLSNMTITKTNTEITINKEEEKSEKMKVQKIKNIKKPLRYYVKNML